MKNKFLYIGGAVALLVLIAWLYSAFFKPSYGGTNVMGILLLGLLLGGVIAFLLAMVLRGNKQETKVVESSHTVIESMRKVFKIVAAEGQFNEIYNYEETKKLFNFLPNTKKALVIVQAKVLMGYNFEKAKWEQDPETHKVRIVSFPEPEILSLETELKYYNMEEHFFNMFSRDDLEKIQKNAKKQVEIAAQNSNLKRIAAEQMRTLLTEVIQSNNWVLEDSYKIGHELPPPPEQKLFS